MDIFGLIKSHIEHGRLNEVGVEYGSGTFVFPSQALYSLRRLADQRRLSATLYVL